MMAAICQWSYNRCAKLPTLDILFFAQTAKSLWSIFRGSGSLLNGFEAIGILRLSERHMPMD
jgi:hypothetical protein